MNANTHLKFSAPAHRSAIVAAVCIAWLVGCASGSAPKPKPKYAAWDIRRAAWWDKEEEKPAPEVPTRLVATWTETVLNQAGETPKRGFGGRIAFFKRESKDAIRVDGQLVVYAFDETSRPAHETQPTRKYIFPAEEFARHEGDSAMGPSYSFWLPWDEVGGAQRNISLIVRFEPKDGPIVIGEQTKHFLPGSSLEPETPQLARQQSERSAVVNSVRLAGYSKLAEEAVPTLAEPATQQQQLTPADAAGRAKMSTETIALPPRLGNALQQAPTPGNSVTTFDPVMTGNLPLSQVASMRASQSAAQPEQNQAAAALPAAQAVAPPQSSGRPSLSATAAERAAGSESLRDSLRATLPAQGRQPAPRGPVRAR